MGSSSSSSKTKPEEEESKDPADRLLEQLVEDDKEEEERKECCDPRSIRPQYILVALLVPLVFYFLITLVFSLFGICDKLHGRTFLCRVNKVQPSGYSVLVKRSNETDGRLTDSFALTPQKLSPEAIPFACLQYDPNHRPASCEYQVGNVGFISMWSDGSIMYIYSGTRIPSASFVAQKTTWCETWWDCLDQDDTGPALDLIKTKSCVESYISTVTVNGAHSYRPLEPNETCDRVLKGFNGIPDQAACARERWDNSDFIFLAMMSTLEVNQCNCGSVLAADRCIPNQVAELDAIYNQRTVAAGQRPPPEIYG